MALQEIPRASPPLGTDHLPYDEFVSLGRSLVVESGDVAVEFGINRSSGMTGFVLATTHRRISVVTDTRLWPMPLPARRYRADS